MHFGENQLSPSLIGLSPLPTAHPPGFQPWWVRASTPSYLRFTVALGRSPGFASRARCYLGNAHRRRHAFTYRTLTVYGRPSQSSSANTTLSHSPPSWQTRPERSHNPAHTTPARSHMRTV